MNESKSRAMKCKDNKRWRMNVVLNDELLD